MLRKLLLLIKVKTKRAAIETAVTLRKLVHPNLSNDVPNKSLYLYNTESPNLSNDVPNKSLYLYILNPNKIKECKLKQ